MVCRKSHAKVGGDVLYVQLAILSPCLETRNLPQYIRQTLTQRFEDPSDYDRSYAILQQDSVTADAAINLALWLQNVFGGGGTATQRGLWPPHSRGFSGSHITEAPQSVGLLLTSDQLVAETST